MRSIALVSLLLILAGCGDVEGEGDFPGTVVYTSEDGAYRLRYLDPPGRIVEAEDPETLRLVAEVRGGVLGETGSDVPTHVMDLTEVPEEDGETACWAASAEAIALGSTIEVEHRYIENFYGDRGHEFLSRDPMGLKHRDAFFTLPDGRVVRLAFASALDTEDPGVDLILYGFEPL